ncbi:helix-hairpin-helix domain-containing protein [Carboxylicivirga marina]|uniref:helix-hairpin-helix domain-containing protein n=1 Tax=Carboxylicivirga marina TaxID=2800988 RepID=UPI002599E722|nr:helix-hairpin-helix domain-containing protein [uncultured Carboxylicivirga sp.]
MNMIRSFVLTICLCISTSVVAQQDEDLQKMIIDMLETMADQKIGNANYEELVNDLVSLSQHPINLNEAEKEELEQLFFLSDLQIENILFYRYTNGQLFSIYELQAVEKMDSETIRYLLPFVTVAPVEQKVKMRVFGNIMSRMQSTIQTPVGYLAKNDSTSAAFLGSKEKWMMRGRIKYGDKLDAGFTLEKDQGEQAFPNYFPAADFSSAFLRFNKPVKFIDSWIIGDYRLSFGQGVGVWTDMAFSKSTETAQLRRRAKGINAYTSVNESSFLRGSALRFKFRGWSFSPFVSYKKRDASFVSDSVNDMLVSSLQETGYHRTATELTNRMVIKEKVYGAQTTYKHHLFHIDAGYVNWQIDDAIEEKTHLKNKYRFSGNKQESLWLAHSIFLHKLTVFGEVAIQNLDDYGVYQGITYNSGFDVVVSLAYRKYSKGYTAILSNPFSESSTRGGESGVFTSIRLKPASRLTIKAFTDMFQYDWLRYNVYRPSEGFEWFAQANYDISQQHLAYVRYKSTQKEINSSVNSALYQVISYQKDNIRLFYAYQPSDKWRFQTQFEQAIYREEVSSKGWMAFQDVKYTSGKYQAALRYVLFDIDDYNSRIYSYEPDVLYAFTIPAYMNKGTRIILNLNVKPIKNLRIWGRVAHTNYTGLKQIGSGHQLIEGNQLTEWKLQLQYRF